MFTSNTLITGGSFTQLQVGPGHLRGRVQRFIISIFGVKPVFRQFIDPFERLQAEVSPGAFHDSDQRFDPPKCHPNTRVAILEKIMDWIRRLEPEALNEFITWLYGPAGAGKTAIAQTIAEICDAAELLLASFFFSTTDPQRNNARSLIATLAYQVAVKFPAVKDSIMETISRDPLIFTRSLESQFAKLIAGPLQPLIESGLFDDPLTPRLIVIDGLDECDTSAVQRENLKVISNARQKHSLPLLFLVASRPQHHIHLFFQLNPCLKKIALSDSHRTSNDIRNFLCEEFEKTKMTHPSIPSSWPTDDVVDLLVRNSSGNFIYASTVAKYIDSPDHHPPDQLDIILGISIPETNLPFMELDALYLEVLSRSGDIKLVLRLIGKIILFPRLDTQRSYIENNTLNSLTSFLDVKSKDIRLALRDLGAIINIRHHPKLRVEIIDISHASLRDFLLDKTRSKQFYINPSLMHAEFAHRSFELLKNRSPLFTRRLFIRMLDHSSCSYPTVELRRDFVEVSFPFIYGIIGQNPDFPLRVIVPKLIWCWENLSWDESKDVLNCQMEMFDKFLIEKLETYYSHPQLAMLLSTVLCLDTSLSHESLAVYLLDKPWAELDSGSLDLLSYIHDVIRCRKQDVDLAYWPNEYIIILKEFLENKNRSKEHFFDGLRYANAAVEYLKNQCNATSSRIITIDSWGNLPNLLDRSANSEELTEFLLRVDLPGGEGGKLISAVDRYLRRVLSSTRYQATRGHKHYIGTWCRYNLF